MHLDWSMNIRRLILMLNENFITEIVSSLVVLYAQKDQCGLRLDFTIIHKTCLHKRS